MRALRHGGACDELQITVMGNADCGAFQRPVESIPHAGLRNDAGGIVRTQRTAQLGHGIRDDVVDRRPVLPDDFEQLLLGHHLARMREQIRKDLERLALHGDGLTVHAQLETEFIELRRAEAKAIERGRRFASAHSNDPIKPKRRISLCPVLFFWRVRNRLARREDRSTPTRFTVLAGF